MLSGPISLNVSGLPVYHQSSPYTGILRSCACLDKNAIILPRSAVFVFNPQQELLRHPEPMVLKHRICGSFSCRGEKQSSFSGRALKENVEIPPHCRFIDSRYLQQWYGLLAV